MKFTKHYAGLAHGCVKLAHIYHNKMLLLLLRPICCVINAKKCNGGAKSSSSDLLLKTVRDSMFQLAACVHMCACGASDAG